MEKSILELRLEGEVGITHFMEMDCSISRLL